MLNFIPLIIPLNFFAASRARAREKFRKRKKAKVHAPVRYRFARGFDIPPLL
jgi:hypothetical protein